MFSSSRRLRLWALTAIIMLGATSASASTFQIIHQLNGASGTSPQAVVLDPGSGKLYVTLRQGSIPADAGGAITQLTPPSPTEPAWQALRIRGFPTGATGSGDFPVSKIFISPSGMLFGTTSQGGGADEGCADCSPLPGQGAVFSLNPPVAGGTKWFFTNVKLFLPGVKGEMPLSGVTMDANHNLFGVTSQGGGSGECGANSSCGVVYELVPPNTSRNWTEHVLYIFKGGTDGYSPESDLTIGSDGSLYGTTSGGLGTVYRLTPPAPGGNKWRYERLHEFSGGPDGGAPVGDLYMDAQGTIYGATSSGGGANNQGTLYKISQSDVCCNKWKTTIIHSFQSDGLRPTGGVVADAAGNLFGTETDGADYSAIYKLVPPAAGEEKWKEIWEYEFRERPHGGGLAGRNPTPLAIDASGALYGGASGGEVNVNGLIFKFTP